MAVSRILIDAARFGNEPSRILLDDGEALVEVRLYPHIRMADFAKEIDELSQEHPTSVLVFDTAGIGADLAEHWRVHYGAPFAPAIVRVQGYRRQL